MGRRWGGKQERRKGGGHDEENLQHHHIPAPPAPRACVTAMLLGPEEVAPGTVCARDSSLALVAGPCGASAEPYAELFQCRAPRARTPAHAPPSPFLLIIFPLPSPFARSLHTAACSHGSAACPAPGVHSLSVLLRSESECQYANPGRFSHFLFCFFPAHAILPPQGLIVEYGEAGEGTMKLCSLVCF